MSVRKTAIWIGVSFVLFFLLSSPTDSGDVVQSAFDGIRRAAEDLAMFVRAWA